MSYGVYKAVTKKTQIHKYTEADIGRTAGKIKWLQRKYKYAGMTAMKEEGR